MRRDIADRWVALLRSGKFRQTRRLLHNNGGYCCLGVLCELAVADGVIPPGVTVRDDSAGRTRYVDDTAVLPREVQFWAGIRTQSGMFDKGRELTALNDQGAAFDEIATIIEQHVDDL